MGVLFCGVDVSEKENNLLIKECQLSTWLLMTKKLIIGMQKKRENQFGFNAARVKRLCGFHTDNG